MLLNRRTEIEALILISFTVLRAGVLIMASNGKPLYCIWRYRKMRCRTRILLTTGISLLVLASVSSAQSDELPKEVVPSKN